MFRDKEEELQRLQAELLQQDEPDEQPELPEDEDELLDEDEQKRICTAVWVNQS